MKIKVLLLTSVLFFSCEKYYVSVYREAVDETTMASFFAKTPDPSSENPPRGQRLFVEWILPRFENVQGLHVILTVIFKDYSELRLTEKMHYPRGVFSYSLLDEEFKKKKGILTYKAEIIDADGQVIKEWKHQLWADLITIEEESSLDDSQSNSSVETQSRQGSVLESCP